MEFKERAVQFRKWATRVVEEFTIKGFAMDDERLKRGGGKGGRPLSGLRFSRRERQSDDA